MERTVELRAEWLTRVGEAIDSAQRLAWELGKRDGVSEEARQLYRRLESVRQEVDSMHAAELVRLQSEFDWLKALGWDKEEREGD